ncbi:MAG: ribosome maturation factor RimP [Gammaproteobacteria bacterium]
MATDLRDKLIALLEPELGTIGYELVELEYKPRGHNGLLRLYIDAADGIGLDDCAKVSRRVSALLDVEDPIPGAYELEVSSPGLNRPLRTIEHYRRFAGEKVKVQTVRPIEGQRRFKGVLRAVEGTTLQLEVDGEERVIPLDLVERASLAPDA